jgi:hypothetical protein
MAQGIMKGGYLLGMLLLACAFVLVVNIAQLRSFYNHHADDANFAPPYSNNSSLHLILQSHDDTHFAPVRVDQQTRVRGPSGIPSTPPSNSPIAKVPLPTRLKLFHVVNFYSSVPNNNHNHNTDESSLDQIQSLTMASVIRARKHVMALSHLDIRLVGAVFPEDAHVIPDDFEIRYLNRSTVSEYSNSTLLNKKTKLPFLQDLIKGVVTDEDKDDFDYFIYTNSDIGLDPSFYNHVAEIIGRGYDAFSINRHNLPETFYQPALEQSTLDLEQLYSIHAMGYPHPGKDCFVISKAVWHKLHLGTLFVGHPPWGKALDRILQQVATNYYNFKSHEDVTFHLGNDKAWNAKKDKIKLTEAQHRLVWSCPIHAKEASPYLLKNMINCAALFDLFEGQNRTYKHA